MKIGSKVSDFVGIMSGFSLANPEGEILNNVTTLLNTSPIISQNAADEIAKLLAGLVVTILSRWIFSAIESRKKKKESKDDENPSDEMPLSKKEDPDEEVK